MRIPNTGCRYLHKMMLKRGGGLPPMVGGRGIFQSLLYSIFLLEDIISCLQGRQFTGLYGLASWNPTPGKVGWHSVLCILATPRDPDPMVRIQDRGKNVPTHQCCGSGSVWIRTIFQDPDPFPGCLGSGFIRYSHEHNKITWKRELNKEYFLCGSCWTYWQGKWSKDVKEKVLD